MDPGNHSQYFFCLEHTQETQTAANHLNRPAPPPRVDPWDTAIVVTGVATLVRDISCSERGGELSQTGKFMGSGYQLCQFRVGNPETELSRNSKKDFFLLLDKVASKS